MLYEALTGELPFTGTNYNALLRAIVETTPTPVKALGAGDAALSSIIDRGMAKDRADRWGSMAELGKALAHWLLSQGITEDMCGVSLEAKWLGRSTDPPSRASRASFPDFERTPHSGLRPTLPIPRIIDGTASRHEPAGVDAGACPHGCGARTPARTPSGVCCTRRCRAPRSGGVHADQETKPA